MADRNVFASALSHRNPQTMAARAGLSLPAIAFPVLALGFVILAAVVGPNVAAPASPLSGVLSAAMIAIMLGAVFAAVEFADVIAHRVGEPYGVPRQRGRTVRRQHDRFNKCDFDYGNSEGQHERSGACAITSRNFRFRARACISMFSARSLS
jgi:hypothetical protein